MAKVTNIRSKRFKRRGAPYPEMCEKKKLEILAVLEARVKEARGGRPTLIMPLKIENPDGSHSWGKPTTKARIRTARRHLQAEVPAFEFKFDFLGAVAAGAAQASLDSQMGKLGM
jgi:hypothetical protein